MTNRIFIIGFVLLAVACKSDPKEDRITNPADYDTFLSTAERPTYDEAVALKEYWSKRLRPDSSGVGELAPLGGAYEALFQETGDAGFLKSAEQLYRKGQQISAHNKDLFARALAHNYISQHRFKKAYTLLSETLAADSDIRATRLQLFDAAMEVGAFEEAYEHLNAVKNLSDYNYLIRLSKWSDHRGDLDNAIVYMEKAKAIAESRNSRPLKIWTYSNLADYYGHAGRISEAYNHYLKTLALQPDNNYVKKGIAWVVYSEEKNTAEAHRILDSVMQYHQVPDYHLFKAELYEYEGLNEAADKAVSAFLASVAAGDYGEMYNTYLIEMYAETNPSKALDLAKKELENRSTPEIYHLLALAQLKNGSPKKALETIERYVKGKTSEPMAQYHSALVYKANGMVEEVESLTSELIEAAYELGPVLTRKIAEL